MKKEREIIDCASTIHSCSVLNVHSHQQKSTQLDALLLFRILRQTTQQGLKNDAASNRESELTFKNEHVHINDTRNVLVSKHCIAFYFFCKISTNSMQLR